MDAPTGLGRAALGPPSITTTDLWKLAGIVLLLADHYGLFFDPDTDGWRVVGRLAAPIFFFLIGYARTREVPVLWIGLGLLLTAVDAWTGEGPSKVTLNILLNFAWLRLVRPSVEAHVLGRPWRVAAAAVAATALIPVVAPLLEYGAEGWLWALFGATHRHAQDTPEDVGAGPTRDALAVFVAVIYIWREIVDYEFEGVDALALLPLVAGVAFLLARFTRRRAPWQPPAALAPAIRYCGRHSLEIYGLSLLAMQLLGYALGD